MVDVLGKPLIIHVWQRAIEADVGEVVVATDHVDIASVVAQAGGRAVITRNDHASGTDRIAEALSHLDSDRKHDIIINIQGDLPTVSPDIIRSAASMLEEPSVDIGTTVAVIKSKAEERSANTVKMVGFRLSPKRFRALYFTRALAPFGEGPLFQHIGLYAWRRASIERFVALPPSPLEVREKLEQLRALEAGMRIDCALVESAPVGVDTPEDLVFARAVLASSIPT